ncbi:MAG: hypothetical protein ACREIE_05080, partial [Nitrospiraceae bacterium]
MPPVTALMTLSIRWKVTLATLFAVTLALAVAGWLALRSIERAELSRVAEALEARTSLAAFALEPLLAQAGAGRSTSPQQIQSMARELSRHALARVTVIGPDGTVLADSDTPDDAVSRLENHGTRPEVIQALSEGYGTDIRLSATVGQRMYYLALPIKSGNQIRGVARLAIPLTTLESRIRDLKRAVSIAFGLAFAVSVALSVLFARGVTRPLSAMADV